jgi:hypothetical protein
MPMLQRALRRYCPSTSLIMSTGEPYYAADLANIVYRAFETEFLVSDIREDSHTKGPATLAFLDPIYSAKIGDQYHSKPGPGPDPTRLPLAEFMPFATRP